MKWPAIPSNADPAMVRYLRDIANALDSELRVRVPNTVGVSSSLLVSPAGKVYSVQVADDGTLSTTLVNE